MIDSRGQNMVPPHSCTRAGRPGLVSENLPKRQLWNVNEVAAFLGIKAQTVRDMVYRRSIPYRKVGRCLRFDPLEIEQWTRPNKE
jgi:excisionase family DNA binding protein